MNEVSTSSGHGPGDSSPKKSPVFLGLLLIVVVLILGGAFMMFQRRAQYQALADNTEVLAVPTVAVIHPAPQKGDENLVLPGTLQAYVESPIYARTNGYVKRWTHDIGSRVNKSDLLAEIDDWVDRGIAPHALFQVAQEAKPPFTVTASRPMCRYPAWPRYRGEGSPKEAASFACVTDP